MIFDSNSLHCVGVLCWIPCSSYALWSVHQSIFVITSVLQGSQKFCKDETDQFKSSAWRKPCPYINYGMKYCSFTEPLLSVKLSHITLGILKHTREISSCRSHVTTFAQRSWMRNSISVLGRGGGKKDFPFNFWVTEIPYGIEFSFINYLDIIGWRRIGKQGKHLVLWK